MPKRLQSDERGGGCKARSIYRTVTQGSGSGSGSPPPSPSASVKPSSPQGSRRTRRRNQARKGVRMPKCRQSDERGGGCKSRRRPMQQRRHLYLVLDDWSRGYSIRKIDPTYDCFYAGLQPLSTPMYQLEAPRRLAMSFAASLGSKIMFPHPLRNETYCFDVRSRSLIYGPRPDGVPVSQPTFIPIGNRLWALWGGSLQLLHESSDDLWSWRKLLDLPFDESSVTSYALHPDGHIFVSVEVRELTSSTSYRFDADKSIDSVLKGDTLCTYIFDVDLSNDCVLIAKFNWTLPFKGRSYFVNELNSWVGLSGSYDSIGHLCACDDLDPDSKSLKISKESLFSNNLAESHVGATLVYMGSKSEFCLVECISVGYSYICEGPLKPLSFDPLLQFKDKLYHPLLRLTMFSLMVDENGDLTTGNKRVQYYTMPESVSMSSMECPVAFWL